MRFWIYLAGKDRRFGPVRVVVWLNWLVFFFFRLFSRDDTKEMKEKTRKNYNDNVDKAKVVRGWKV